MFNFYNTQIDSLSVHLIGNKSKNESVLLSSLPHTLDDHLSGLLKSYFFKPFTSKEIKYYEFIHSVDLEFNTLYELCTKIFSNPSQVHEFSKQVALHLYEQSQHPHIKKGEVYVVYFDGILVNSEKFPAIGIFKSEIKNDFLQFDQKDMEKVEIVFQQGVNLSKLDKGCLIFNTDADNGYKMVTVDANRYDTKYWLDHFLGVAPKKDETFLTKHYIKMCQDFAKEVVLPAEDKKQEVLFINKTVDHFAKNESFNESTFLNEVLDNPSLILEFKNYKEHRAEKYDLDQELVTFPIANKAVSDSRKKIKNQIQLDTNIQIKMDFVNAQSAENFIEKGWDEEKGMYYYLLYFNKED